MSAVPDTSCSLWEDAVKKFEKEHECQSSQFVQNGSDDTPEDILEHADLDFDKFRKKGETLRSTIKPFTETLLSMSELVGHSFRLIFPPAQAITAGIVVLIKGSKQLGENYDAIRDLLADLQFLLKRMGQYASLDPTQDLDPTQQIEDMIVESLVQTLNVIRLAATAVKDGRCRGFLRTLVHKDRKIKEVVAKLDRMSTREGHTVNLSILKGTANIFKEIELSIASQNDHSKTVQSILTAITDQLPSIKDETVEEIRQLNTPMLDAIRQKQLKKIKPKFEYQVEHDPCLEGTRSDILDIIYNWVDNVDAPNVFWLYGHPGTGKSAIATTIRHELVQQRRLGAACFFQREDAEFHKHRDVVLSIASDLANKHAFIGTSLIKKLQDGKVDVKDASSSQLFEDLMVETLHEVAPGFNDTIVVVIDALDEFGGADPYNNVQFSLLNILLPHWNRIPSRFKLFVTSRDQGYLSRRLKVNPNWFQSLEVGENATTQSSKDIRRFFEIKLSLTSERPGWVAWTPPPRDLETLTKAASGLFIWASTVVNLVSRRRAQFDEIVTHVRNGSLIGNTPLEGLEKLYQSIIQTASQNWDAQKFLTVCGAIITAKIPLSCTSLSSLLQLDERDIDDIVAHLRPVLDSSSSRLRFVHKSFVDYMTSDRCPEQLRCISVHQEQNMLEACFAVMERQLHFNIGEIGSSYLFNKDITGLIDRILESIKYACRFWSSHLESAGTSITTKAEAAFQRFFNHFFLFWLEIMSITKCLDEALHALAVLLRNIGTSREDLALQAQDAESFIRAFAVPISQSYPHIYLSALPFSPKDSFIRSRYMQFYPSTINALSGLDVVWTSQLGVMQGHRDVVTSVAFSPDGKQIASASFDKTICLWDSITYQPIGEPLRGHTEKVMAIAFSPDGNQILSGSEDTTIRLWDAYTRQPIEEPFQGHEGEVTSVAFSPDGGRIASSSWDMTIRVWDANTRQFIGEPIQEHQGKITSVAFSPDGIHIISASSEMIRLWDATTKQPVSDPLKGHKNWVESVAFSRDGRWIVSGAWDNTVRLWDAAIRQPFRDPLQGHENWVMSVAFSLNGQQIVSASHDKTIRIWDVATHRQIGKPFRGHEGPVTSVSFSPDGNKIVSGSEDMTLRVWNTANNHPIAEGLQADEGEFMAVAFSPDGTQIASTSMDNTICFWDAATCQPVGDPLRGHKGQVMSVAFSPDGKQVISASQDKTIRLWNAVSHEPIREPLRGHEGWVTSVAFSPNGKQIVSASNDKTIRIWDIATNQSNVKLLLGHQGTVTSIAFSPSGHQVVSGSEDMTICLWDADLYRPIIKLLREHPEKVMAVAFAPDGKQFASASCDNTICLWDIATCQPFQELLRGHEAKVTSIAFSPDGMHIVSGSSDRTIRLWNAAVRQPIGEPHQGHEGEILSVSFSHDGRQIVSSSSDKTIRIWNVEALLALESQSPYQMHLRAIGSHPSHFLLDDGWVLENNTLERLFWIPHHLHRYIQSPGLTGIIGTRDMVKLDLTLFCHGESWTKCGEGPSKSK